MKVKILTGLVTSLIYGNAAMAQDVDDTNDELIILEQEDVAPVPDTGIQDKGVGGSGFEDPEGLEDQEGFGGAGQAEQPMQPRPGMPMRGQGGMMLHCVPVHEEPTGGSGPMRGDEQSSLQRDHDVEVEVGEVEPFPREDAFGGSGYEARDEGKEKADMRGLTVLVGAGVEGYTGGLAPEINPGPTVGVVAGLRPTKTIGLELGYSGAVNNLDTDVSGSGPDIVRNGAVANLTLGLTATPVQPYLLGGFGMNWYNVRNGEELGFNDDTNSRVPVGVGLRTHIGDFTADARVNYNILLSEDFAPGGVDDDLTTGSYQGTINLGGTF